jgi:tetratricopeptide (TPR) repeat protein
LVFDGDLQGHAVALRSQQRADVENHRIRLALGAIQAQQGHLQAAENTLSTLLTVEAGKAHPRAHADAHHVMGLVALQAGQFPDAARFLLVAWDAPIVEGRPSPDTLARALRGVLAESAVDARTLLDSAARLRDLGVRLTKEDHGRIGEILLSAAEDRLKAHYPRRALRLVVSATPHVEAQGNASSLASLRWIEGRALVGCGELARARMALGEWIDGAGETDRSVRVEAVSRFYEDAFLFDEALRIHGDGGLASEGPLDGSRVARLLLKTGEVRRAERVLERHVESLPPDERLQGWLDAARNMARFKQSAAAGRLLARASEADPDSLLPLGALTRIHMANGHSPQVLTAVAEFLKAQSDSPEALAGVARLLRDLGFAEEALTHYVRAVDAGVRDPEVLLELADLAEVQGDWQRRNQAFDFYIAGAPDSGAAEATVGLRYADYGNARSALRHLKAAVKSDATRIDVTFALADLYRSERRSRDERRVLERLERAHPRPGQVRLARAHRLVREGLRSAAIQMYAGVADSVDWPERGEALQALVLLHAKQGVVELVELGMASARLRADPRVTEKMLSEAIRALGGIKGIRDERMALLESLADIQEAPAETWWALAQEAVAAGDPRRMSHAVRRYIGSSTDHVDAARTRGVGGLIDAGFAQEAMEILREVSGEITDPVLCGKLGTLHVQLSPHRDRVAALRWFRCHFEGLGTDQRTLREAGDIYFDAGFHALALETYLRAARLAPGAARITERLIIVHLRMGNVAAATEMASQLTNRRGNAPAVHESLAQLWWQSGSLKQAVHHLEEAHVPEHAGRLEDVFKRLVEAARRLGEPDVLRRNVRTHLDMVGETTATLLLAGQAFVNMGLDGEALEHFRRGLALRPSHEDSLLEWVGVMHRQGETERLEVPLERMLGLAGWDEDVVRTVAERLVGLGRDRVAAHVLDAAVAHHPGSAGLHLARGEARLRSGTVSEALVDFRRAMTRSRDMGGVLERIHPLLRSARRLKDFEALVRFAAEAQPTRSAHLVLLHGVLLEREKLVEAKQVARDAVGMDADSMDAIAAQFALHGHTQDAENHWMKSIEAATPGDIRSEAMNSMVEALFAGGRGEEVPRLVARWSRRIGDAAEGYPVTADIYLKSHRVDEAIEALIRASESYERPQLRLWIAQMLLRQGEVTEAAVWLGRFVEGPKKNESKKEPGEHDERVLKAAALWRAHGHSGRARALLRERLEQGAHAPGRILSGLVRHHLAMPDVVGALQLVQESMEAATNIAPAEAREIGAEFQRVGEEAAWSSHLRQRFEVRFARDWALEWVRQLLRDGEVESAIAVGREWQTRIPPDAVHERLRLARTLVEANQLGHADAILAELWTDPATATWKEATHLRLQLRVLRGDSADTVRAVFREAADLRDDRIESWNGLRDVARNLQLWECERDALDALDSLEPRDRDLSKHRIEVAIAAGTQLEQIPQLVDELLARSTNVREELRWLLRLFREHFRYEFAGVIVDRLIRLDRHDVGLHLDGGQLALERGDVGAARAAFARYEEQHAAKSVARREIALSYMDAWLTSGTDAAAAALVSREDADVSTGMALGASRLRSGDWSGATDAFVAAAAAGAAETTWTEASRLALDTPDVPVGLARDYADRALAVQASLPEAQLIRGLARLRLGESQGAKRDLARWRSGGFGLEDGLKRVAEVAFASGDIAFGEETLQQLFDLPQDQVRLLEIAIEVIRTVLHQASPELSEDARARLREIGLGYVEQVVSLVPSEGWFLALKSDILEGAGDLAAAEQVYRDAIAQRPLDSSVLNNLSYLYARRGEQLEDARALVRRARAIEPRHSIYYLDTEGWVAFKQGRYQEALALVRGSLRQMHEGQGAAVAESFWHLGQVLEKLERVDDALRSYRKAARLDPVGRYGRKALRDLRRLDAIRSVPP